MPTILAIDDKPDNLLSLSALLKSMIPGCRVVTALSGHQGIEMAKIENPDTILLDIYMPEMDGFEACRILKSDPATKHIPVIMLTAVHTGLDNRVKGLELGADTFLTKPVDQFELAAQIKAMLRIKYAEDVMRQESKILEQKVAERTAELVKNRDQLISEIEERKLIENALKKSEVRFRTIFELSPDLLGSVNIKEGYFISISPAWAMFGRPLEEFISRPFMDFIHPDDQNKTAKQVKYMQSGQTIFGFENRYRCKDGSYKNIEWCTTAAQADGMAYVTGRDITERKQARVEREKLQTQLTQAQKMESIGILAGGIAHDFNNILFPIVGYAEMLIEDSPEDTPFRESLNEIYNGSLRARDLVQQILAFSRQGKCELKLMKMQPIIKEALKLIRSTIPTTIHINQNLQPDCGPVTADPTQIHQLVMNLTTNAYHAMEENVGELNVSLKEIKLGEQELITPDMTPGSYACLTIADTGMGMDKNLIDKIFEPFFTTKEKGKGTGMGLSVVHGIVKSMNGEIQVHSEPGKGTEFYVFLPIFKSAYEKKETQTSEPILGGTERVLLVDDEKSIIAMGRQVLERLGYQVTSRTSSIEALEAFRANPDKFDLIITDMAMPKMPGDKLAVELIKIRPDIPILLCTGYSESMMDEKIKSLGIKGFLKKPIVVKDLAKKIREVLIN